MTTPIEPTSLDLPAVTPPLKTSPTRARLAFYGWCVFFLAMFAGPLVALLKLALGSDLHSHALLIPFISAYLLHTQRERLPAIYQANIGSGVALTVLSGVTAAFALGLFGKAPEGTAYVSTMMLALVGLINAGGFLFLGSNWMRAAAFPMTFLVFLAPLPEVWESALENGLKLASSEASAILFEISGTPFLRDGNIFQLPGIVLEVAQECSGIRSSYVLFITSIVAAQLFLHSPWRRIVLVGLVIPLGIIRNGFRILVIGLLCVHVGPEMIHSIIHRRGGPLFFALSLIPLFLILWLLRRGDRAAGSTLPDVSPKEPPRSETAP